VTRRPDTASRSEADPSEPHVEFVGVDKSYDGETLVVRGLDLAVRRGEFLTLLGPSGSGKTTCLMMLAGFEAPTAGEIRLAGRSLARLPPHKRNIGMVFQNYALFPHMSVAENLAFPLRARRMGRAEIARRVERVLEMVRLAGLGGRRPAALSGGQQQRVAVARALVFEPELVLMDEPLGALDKQLREQMQLELKHLHRTVGVTFLYVTHDQAEALTMSDRIAVFEDGRIRQLDTPEGLYDRPQNSFVADFIGESNRLEGHVLGPAGGLCAVEACGGRRLLALPVCPAEAGQPTRLSVRPERISLAPLDGEAVNRLPARVLETIYFGDHRRVRVALDGGGELVVKLPFAAGGEPAEDGSRVEVSWRAEHCRALDPP
jgi:putative spermidine/putrescine transport system ATP-binding protein